MPKTKDRVSDAADTVKPYVQRALKDEELRENVKSAFDAARDVYNELFASRGMVPIATRVATDKDIQDSLKSAVDDLRNAADRLRGKEDHGGRNMFLLAHLVNGDTIARSQPPADSEGRAREDGNPRIRRRVRYRPGHIMNVA
jgi:hypothetical protein